MKSFNQIQRLPEFERDLKKLLKKYPSLEEDLRSFIRIQLIAYHMHQIDNQGILPIQSLGIINPKICKVKKFACKAMKGKGVQSGIRIIYAYFPDTLAIVFIEIYYKGDQENENKDRIKFYFNNQ